MSRHYPLVTIEFPSCAGMTPDDAQHEAEFDAERCVKALKKRWPMNNFRRSLRPGAWSVDTDIDVARENFSTMSVFAEGFMASSHLWER